MRRFDFAKNTKGTDYIREMRKKISFVLLLVIAFSQFSKAQNNYWIFLRDKHFSHFNPQQYFDSKAIERRVNTGIPFIDSTDFPVS